MSEPGLETDYPTCPKCGKENTTCLDPCMRDVDNPSIYDGEVIEITCDCGCRFKSTARVVEVFTNETKEDVKS